MNDYLITQSGPTSIVSRLRVQNLGRRGFLFLLVITSASVALAQAGESTIAPADTTVADNPSAAEPVNTFCPVMPEMKVNPEIYSDYNGKRIWFCCTNCRTTFERNPEKYLALLPQFGGGIEGAPHKETHAHSFNIARLIEPLGITTLTLLILTFLAGIFRRKAPKLLFTWHKRLAFATVTAAIIHAILVFTAY